MSYLTRGREHPERYAIVEADGAWSYAQLEQRAQCVAGALVATHGVRPGDRLGLFLPRRRDSVATLLGIFQAGAIGVPFGEQAAARELAHLIIDAQLTHVIIDPKLRAVAEAALTLAGTHSVRPKVIDGPSLFSVEDPVAAVVTEANTPALILYTSGTTGLPKGVVHTHASLQAQVAMLATAWEWSAEDRLLHVLPLHHVHGLVNGVLGALWVGASLTFLPRFEPQAVWTQLSEQKPSVLYAVPTMYHQLIESWEQANPETQQRWRGGGTNLRLAVSGSAALPSRLWHRWQEITGQQLLERYGMTEIGMALSNPYRGERRPGTVGQPLPGVVVRVVTETGAEAAAGEPGELWVRGPAVFREYWCQPEATAAAFADGYFRTGDVVEFRDGSYRMCGRASVDILKSGGYKISALEIEQVLCEHRAVREVAVIGVPDPEWGEVVTACVVCHPGTTVTLPELRDWCQDQLAAYKSPRRLELFRSLPRNAMGKVGKPELVRQLTTAR